MVTVLLHSGFLVHFDPVQVVPAHNGQLHRHFSAHLVAHLPAHGDAVEPVVVGDRVPLQRCLLLFHRVRISFLAGIIFSYR